MRTKPVMIDCVSAKSSILNSARGQKVTRRAPSQKKDVRNAVESRNVYENKGSSQK
jgi:hypothetical protein